jgi:hypothetical protein
VGTRVQVAAWACFVACGLFISSLGGALAFAEPSRPPADPSGTQSHEVPGGSSHGPSRGPKDEPDGDKGDGEKDDSNTDKHDGEHDSENGDGEHDGENGDGENGDEETPPSGPSEDSSESDSPSDPPEYPCEQGSNRKDCEPSPSSTTSSAPGLPGPGGGGGDGPGNGAVPGALPVVPAMQIPPHVGVEREPPTVVDAAPGIGVAAGQLPPAPLTLPVIVAPAVVPGVGAGGGGGPAPANPVSPPLPRAVTAELPAGRNPLPANVGSNALVPASTHRIGYTEYLRTAGIPQVAALALPGLAGMLVLTCAGGMVGYRQAKAGLAVRTGGTARFVEN